MQTGIASRLICLLALLAGVLTISPVAVRAQSAIQPTAVLDFAVDNAGDPILGRKAADALAVELQRSGDFEVATRQQVEAAVQSQPGLRPPYNEPTQARLAGVVGARSVFSGRIRRTIVTPRSARVQIEVRQLDSATGDYVNGTQISEISEDKLADTDATTLLDEALNKAAFAAVRAMKQTRLPEGTVLNVTRDDIEINLGAQNGVAPGQRYSVLRDVFNRPRNITERVKIGEVTITRVEANQSTAVITGGGLAGVTTRDKVRQIFTPSVTAPITSSSTGTSTPVTAPPPRTRSRGGILKRGGESAVGLGVLLLLGAFAGLGGGSGGGPGTSPGTPIATSLRTASQAAAQTAIQINWSKRLPALATNQDVAGYLIFRSTSANFSADTSTLVNFTRGNQTSYSETTVGAAGRTITVARGTGTGAGAALLVTEAPSITASAITQAANTLTVVIAPGTGLTPGVQYFYRIARIIGTRTTTTGTGTGGNTGTTTTITIDPVLSNVSGSSGGATAIPTLFLTNGTTNPDGTVAQGSTNNDLRDFIVTLPGTLVRGDIDQITVQLSTSAQFPSTSTFVRVFTNPGQNASGNVVLDLDEIQVPGFSGSEDLPVFVRVGLRNSTDNPGATIFSNALQLVNPLTNQASIGSRFLGSEGIGRRRTGLGLPGRGGSGNKFGTPRRTPPHILRPR